MREVFIKPLVATLAAGIATIILEEIKGVIAAKKQQKQQDLAVDADRLRQAKNKLN